MCSNASHCQKRFFTTALWQAQDSTTYSAGPNGHPDLMEFLPHKNSHLQDWTCSSFAVRTARCCAIKHLQPTVKHLVCVGFFCSTQQKLPEHCSYQAKTNQEGMLPLEGFPALSPSSAPRTAAVTSYIRSWKYCGVKLNSQYMTIFQVTHCCNSAQHYQGTAADLSMP